LIIIVTLSLYKINEKVDEIIQPNSISLRNLLWYQSLCRHMPKFILLLLLSTFSLMASAVASTFSPPTLSQFNGKLEGPNYLAWTTQFLPILCTHDMLSIVDGSEPCPPKLIKDDKGMDTLNIEFSIWNKKDQCILSWINLTLSEKVLSTVYGLDTSRQVWNTLATKFANDSRS
jgi:hypothetical protein